MKVKAMWTDDECQTIINSLVLWLQQYLKQTNKQGYIVGLSGGIDSCLCSFLVQAAAPEHHLIVSLPCSSSRQTKLNTKVWIAKNKFKTLTIKLATVFKAFTKQSSLKNDKSVCVSRKLKLPCCWYW